MSEVPLHWRLLLGLLRRLPQVYLSRVAGWFADRRLPRPLRPLLIGGFARIAGIDRSEAEAPPAEYPSVGAYFTRRLVSDARSWAGPDGLPGSPVDGVVGAMGSIVDGTAVQAKGLRYPVAELLAGVDRPGPDEHRLGTDERLPGTDEHPPGPDDPLDQKSEWWRGGRYLTLYLSPRHYHRIHAPVRGRIPAAVRVPGRLLPVNVPSVRTQPELFVTNARTVVRLDAAGGRLALVAVGAFNVGRISTTFEPDWAEGGGRGDWRTRPSPDRREYDPPVPVERGAELGAFHLGSTVVLVFGPEWDSTFSPELRVEKEIRLGDPLMAIPGLGTGSNEAD